MGLESLRVIITAISAYLLSFMLFFSYSFINKHFDIDINDIHWTTVTILLLIEFHLYVSSLLSKIKLSTIKEKSGDNKK